MPTYVMEIKRLSQAYSQIVAVNIPKAKIDPIDGCIHNSAVRNDDVLDFIADISWPKADSMIHVSRNHPIFITLKNMGYPCSEY